MAFPSFTIEIDFTNPPLTALASNTWTDITQYVHAFRTRRGRQDELARIEAGTAELVLDNSDRRFDPNHVASPYYPNVIPMRKIRISATYASIAYRIFVGFIETWPPSWPGGLDATTTIRCVDAFKYFALKKLNGPYSDEYSNWSIYTWLNNISWPAADRTFSNGQSQILGGTFTNTPALQHFQNVVDVESGLFFMGHDGNAIFQDRHYRLKNSRTSQATFGDASGETPWLKATSKYDDTNIWNEARVKREGGTEQVANNTTSQTTYFTRTYTKTLPIYTDGEALSLAQWIVSLYGSPLFRFTSIALDGLMDDTLWPHMFARQISDRITVRQRPPPIGTAIEQDCYIEGIGFDIDYEKSRFVAIFQLSPAPTGASGGFYWILQDTTLGVLNSTTRLAY